MTKQSWNEARHRMWFVIAVLSAACIAIADFSCNRDHLSGSSIVLDVTGGYSDVRSTHVEFKCSNGRVFVEALTSYWDSKVAPKKTVGAVPMDAYAAAWKRIAELGIWELADKKYAGEDFLTYTVTVGTPDRIHKVFVQNPSEQEDQRYYEIVKEVMALSDTAK